MVVYNKLVRDKIPNILQDVGKSFRIHVAGDKEFKESIIRKFEEELLEFRESPSLEEAADIYEVFLTLVDAWGFKYSAVQKAADLKRGRSGAFQARIILEETIEKHLTSEE